MLIRTKYGVDSAGENAAAVTDDTAFLAEVKDWLGVDYDADDALIKSLIAAAIGYLDGNTGIANRTLITSEWNYILDQFPTSGSALTGCAVTVPLPPSASIVSVSYRDADGIEQTLVENTDYRVNRLGAANFRAQIMPLKSWPAVDSGGDAVKVVYLAGYGQTPTLLPENIKLVIKVIITEWFENRTPRGEAPESPAFKGLLNNLRHLEL